MYLLCWNLADFGKETGNERTMQHQGTLG